ncbi:filamentous hemagglutinin N-terminal domain-containing protein [Hydrogenophaga sp.]|uniref:filamentous hemagglutinin N-terminal domain-containing protein n=2 Tax=unclassified Hydrogenophaga TaxID=2610897 RepID=UPI001AD535FC|nr:filamentous hemagglutinin N-terminal domain-containing protein [Hydrogenophaga sp.]MBN9370760.1 filamentous hemagglutinin N-terminal domain-containing protein [Hydrogenophaga sp.]
MSSKTRQRMVFQRMAMAVAVAMGAWSIGTPAWPQIVADPGAPGRQRPTVLSAGQGVALVNIQTPSAAGVSRNSYRQFDVGAAGAILNNSRGQAQTQLGGWVAGNPWLATGGARIILNEVNSSDPSWLKGPIEVAGQRAEVVIANPSGIQVDGAAFLNASGVTLTTGTPVFNGGALDAYLVQGGQVRVEGAGLDARGADATAILARATQLNAALWAQRLTLVSGANTIDAASQRPTGAAPPTGEAPSFALDVAAVGGMYAGQIQLIGTEAGLGVNIEALGELDVKARVLINANEHLQTEVTTDGGTTTIHSEYASVTEQSGMRAGDGGFDVRVKGKTVLKGGAITSTQAALEEGRNHFASDGGVELQDVQNGASYKASGWSVNAGVYASDKKSSDGSPVLGQDGKPVQEVSRPSGAGWGEDKGSASSTTKAGISGIAGDKDARTGDAQSGISPIFDKEKVKDGVNAQVGITQGFGQQAVPAWRDYANRQFEDAVKAGDEEAAQCWGPDGACRAAGHALVGGLAGGIEGASAAALSSAGAPHLQAFLQSQGVPDEAARAITQLGALGAGAAVGGSAAPSPQSLHRDRWPACRAVRQSPERLRVRPRWLVPRSIACPHRAAHPDR